MQAVDPNFVVKVLVVSHQAASGELSSLQEAEIVKKVSVGKNCYAYAARDLVDVVTLADRKLASTQFDKEERDFPDAKSRERNRKVYLHQQRR